MEKWHKPGDQKVATYSNVYKIEKRYCKQLLVTLGVGEREKEREIEQRRKEEERIKYFFF